jgi:hypothetical protein
MSTDLIKDSEYKAWLKDLKSRIRQSQIKAIIKVNDELLRLYWDLGHDIVVRQMDAVWGSGFFEQLSKELRAEFPDVKGFSVTNLYANIFICCIRKTLKFINRLLIKFFLKSGEIYKWLIMKEMQFFPKLGKNCPFPKYS